MAAALAVVQTARSAPAARRSAHPAQRSDPRRKFGCACKSCACIGCIVRGRGLRVQNRGHYARTHRRDRFVRLAARARPADRCPARFAERPVHFAQAAGWRGRLVRYDRPPFVPRIKSCSRLAPPAFRNTATPRDVRDPIYRISCGASTPSISSPEARTVAIPCTRASRAKVVSRSFWIMKRK